MGDDIDTETPERTPSHRTAEAYSNGVRTKYFEVDPVSHRTPLVVLHGAGVDSALVSYEAVLEVLGRRRRVIAPDLPGYGESDFPDASLSIPWYSEWLVGFIESLGVERVDLAGLSLGGWIALETAISHPDVVRKLVPINPGGLTDEYKWMRVARWMAHHPRANRFVVRSSVGMGRWATRRSLSGRAVVNSEALTDDLVDAVVKGGRAPRAGEAYAATQRWAFSKGHDGWTLIDRVNQIEAETLILSGSEDTLVPTDCAVRAAELIPQGSVLVLDGCGHWLVRDCPDAFTSAVDTFLDGATAGPTPAT